MAEITKDVNGKTSSKRIIAFAGFAVMAAVSLYSIIKDPAQSSNILWPWAVTVTGLLGVTIAERKQ